MARVLRRIFNVPKQRPLLEFEADWSAISPAGLGLMFKELLSDFMGAPPPPEVLEAREFYKRAWKTANVADIYFNRQMVGSTKPGFLVRAVIYDMASLIQKTEKLASRTQDPTILKNGSNDDRVEKLDVTRRDWASLLDLDTNAEANEKVRAEEAVSADQVMESLGLKAVPGLQNRVGSITVRKEKPKSRMEEKQALEEVMGRGDSIRAKYAGKIFQKKMLAEARREQAKLGMVPTVGPKASSQGWQAMPGAPALVRYLEERGVNQALLARGQEEDLTCLLDQLGNYQFQHISHVKPESDNSLLGEPLRYVGDGLMQQRIVEQNMFQVIGTGAQGEAALRATGDSGFFVCRINNSPIEENTKNDIDTLHAEPSPRKPKKGLVSWFNQLKEGTLHVDDDQRSMRNLFPKGYVHFSVTDMVELKWVIEDLNGVSYRKSTLISGFQDLGHGSKQL